MDDFSMMISDLENELRYQGLANLNDSEIVMLLQLYNEDPEAEFMAALYAYRAAKFPSTRVPDGKQDAFRYNGILALGHCCPV